MTTLYNNSFDSSPNSDSDDDFMVDSIMTEHQPSHSETNHRNQNAIPSWIAKDMKCDQMYHLVRNNNRNIGRLPLKRNLASLENHFIKNDRCTKIIKLTAADKTHCINRVKSVYYSKEDSYLKNNSIEININNDNDEYNDESLSNAPSPYAESDKTHSIESSPSCILLNDPIITSVVLNEKRFNFPNDSMNKLPFDDNLFADMPTSFDKSNYSTSIDDNLLTPMRNYQFFAGTSQNHNIKPTIIRNNSLNLGNFTKIESSKRSRSIGSDQEILSRDKRVRSSENLSVRKYVPISIVSETTSDCAHSLSTTASIVNNYSKKIIPSNNGHNKRKHLLQFIIDLLKEGHTCVNWSNKKDNEFFIAQPEKLALLWATYKNNNKMTFDSLARSLRLYYAPKKLERISGKKNHYRILNLSHEISFNL